MDIDFADFTLSNFLASMEPLDFSLPNAYATTTKGFPKYYSDWYKLLYWNDLVAIRKINNNVQGIYIDIQDLRKTAERWFKAKYTTCLGFTKHNYVHSPKSAAIRSKLHELNIPCFLDSKGEPTYHANIKFIHVTFLPIMLSSFFHLNNNTSFLGIGSILHELEEGEASTWYLGKLDDSKNKFLVIQRTKVKSMEVQFKNTCFNCGREDICEEKQDWYLCNTCIEPVRQQIAFLSIE
jgi:hypothetical protein